MKGCLSVSVWPDFGNNEKAATRRCEGSREQIRLDELYCPEGNLSQAKSAKCSCTYTTNT